MADEETAQDEAPAEAPVEEQAPVEEPTPVEETAPASVEVAELACSKCGGPTTPYAGESAHKVGSFECASCNYRNWPPTE